MLDNGKQSVMAVITITVDTDDDRAQGDEMDLVTADLHDKIAELVALYTAEPIEINLLAIPLPIGV